MRELFEDENEFLMVERIVENELLDSGTRASRVRMAMNWVNGRVKIGDVEFHLQPLPSGGNRMKITDGDGSSTIEKFWSREEAETFIANYISKTKGDAAKQMAASEDETQWFAYNRTTRKSSQGFPTSAEAAKWAKDNGGKEAGWTVISVPVDEDHEMAAQDDVTVEFYKDGKRDKAYGYTSMKAATDEADAWAVQGKKFYAVIVDHNNSNKKTRIG